ncbi:glutathione S-transferase family protein [Aspergillus affinis]|uniref:glutathione S-transferase family protein n=1 Tax=Aspergillus affinis TaxID=1070780 RepID=UPI0022FE7E84|nr:uncharacterized protein KD926_011365 [Aspergillus affinis]KAI9038027.1 hypothetical protein KD926_011365 [Aspergillus affinis]
MNVFPHQPSQIELHARPRSLDSAVIAILLEELRLPYEMDLTHRHHPHIPYLTDIQSNGAQIALNDVVSIVSYLVAKYDRGQRISYSNRTKGAAEIQEWVGHLPERSKTQAQAQDRRRIQTRSPSPNSQGEVVLKMIHLYLHLEGRLQDRKSGGYLVGKKCTLADLIHFPAVAAAGSLKLDLERFPELTAWYNRLCERGTVRRGMRAVELEIGEEDD